MVENSKVRQENTVKYNTSPTSISQPLNNSYSFLSIFPKLFYAHTSIYAHFYEHLYKTWRVLFKFFCDPQKAMNLILCSMDITICAPVPGCFNHFSFIIHAHQSIFITIWIQNFPWLFLPFYFSTETSPSASLGPWSFSALYHDTNCCCLYG